MDELQPEQLPAAYGCVLRPKRQLLGDDACELPKPEHVDSVDDLQPEHLPGEGSVLRLSERLQHQASGGLCPRIHLASGRELYTKHLRDHRGLLHPRPLLQHKVRSELPVAGGVASGVDELQPEPLPVGDTGRGACADPAPS